MADWHVKKFKEKFVKKLVEKLVEKFVKKLVEKLKEKGILNMSETAGKNWQYSRN